MTRVSYKPVSYKKTTCSTILNTCKSFNELYIGASTNLLKQTVVYYYCFFVNFEPLIAQRGELWDSNSTYQNDGTLGLFEYFWHLFGKNR